MGRPMTEVLNRLKDRFSSDNSAAPVKPGWHPQQEPTTVGALSGLLPFGSAAYGAHVGGPGHRIEGAMRGMGGAFAGSALGGMGGVAAGAGGGGLTGALGALIMRAVTRNKVRPHVGAYSASGAILGGAAGLPAGSIYGGVKGTKMLLAGQDKQGSTMTTLQKILRVKAAQSVLTSDDLAAGAMGATATGLGMHGFDQMRLNQMYAGSPGLKNLLERGGTFNLGNNIETAAHTLKLRQMPRSLLAAALGIPAGIMMLRGGKDLSREGLVPQVESNPMAKYSHDTMMAAFGKRCAELGVPKELFAKFASARSKKA